MKHENTQKQTKTDTYVNKQNYLGMFEQKSHTERQITDCICVQIQNLRYVSSSVTNFKISAVWERREGSKQY